MWKTKSELREELRQSEDYVRSLQNENSNLYRKNITLEFAKSSSSHKELRLIRENGFKEQIISSKDDRIAKLSEEKSELVREVKFLKGELDKSNIRNGELIDAGFGRKAVVNYYLPEDTNEADSLKSTMLNMATDMVHEEDAGTFSSMDMNIHYFIVGAIGHGYNPKGKLIKELIDLHEYAHKLAVLKE